MGERETERMLEAVFPMAGERRMGSRWRGEKKGVKNVGAEETGGKNRAVSTEAAGYVESGTGGKDRARGLGRGLKERRLEEVVADGRRMVDARERKNRGGGGGERSGRKIETARKTKR